MIKAIIHFYEFYQSQFGEIQNIYFDSLIVAKVLIKEISKLKIIEYIELEEV